MLPLTATRRTGLSRAVREGTRSMPGPRTASAPRSPPATSLVLEVTPGRRRFLTRTVRSAHSADGVRASVAGVRASERREDYRPGRPGSMVDARRRVGACERSEMESRQSDQGIFRTDEGTGSGKPPQVSYGRV